MSQQFSPDNPHNPPTRFRPGPGQIGTHAALQSGKRRAPAEPQPQRRRREQQAQPHLGLPQVDLQESQPDLEHIRHYIRWQNARALGRDLPFGLWAQHNGLHGRFGPEGSIPYDWIEDA